MKNARPWLIVKNINNKTYKLKIPQQIKNAGLTSIFHLLKLHLALKNAFSGQILESTPLIVVSTGNKAHNE